MAEEDKKKPRAERMYGKSPRIEKEKAEKGSEAGHDRSLKAVDGPKAETREAVSDAEATAGTPEKAELGPKEESVGMAGAADAMPVAHVHEREISEMHKRHERERRDMHTRHEQEHKEVRARHDRELGRGDADGKKPERDEGESGTEK